MDKSTYPVHTQKKNPTQHNISFMLQLRASSNHITMNKCFGLHFKIVNNAAIVNDYNGFCYLWCIAMKAHNLYHKAAIRYNLYLIYLQQQKHLRTIYSRVIIIFNGSEI